MAFKEVRLTAKESVKVEITYKASPRPVLAVYDYDLKVETANDPIEHRKGDNQNSQDDIYFLPTPTEDNKGRYILVSSEVGAMDGDADFDVLITVHQDGIETDTLKDSGKVKGNGESVSKIGMIKFK
jgi:hypothetical protein